MRPSRRLIWLSSDIANTPTDTTMSKGTSTRTILCCTASPPTTADTPRIKRMLAMLLPTTLPNATSAFPPSAAERLTASSGALVPNATTVSPMITGAMPSLVAIEAAPFTRSSAPPTSPTSPTMSDPIVNAVTGAHPTSWSAMVWCSSTGQHRAETEPTRSDDARVSPSRVRVLIRDGCRARCRCWSG